MMIILFLLLPTLLRSDVPAKPPSEIDWLQCGIWHVCVCYDSLSTALSGKRFPDPSTPPAIKALEDACNGIGIQNKFFSEDSGIIQMQILSDVDIELGDEPRIVIVDDTTKKEHFGCKYNKATGTVEYVGDAAIKELYEISLFENQFKFENNKIYCVIKIGLAYAYANADRSTQLLRTIFKNTMEYKGPDIATLYKPYTPTSRPGLPPMLKCDPYSFNDLSYSNSHHVKPVWGRGTEEVSCAPHDSPAVTYTMRYDNDKKGKKEAVMIKLVCKDDAGEFDYELHTGEKDDQGQDVVEKVLIPENYQFYCTTNYNEVCENPTAKCKPGGNFECPNFNNHGSKQAGSVSTLECNKKWFIRDKFYELDNEPECRKNDELNDNTSIFYAKLPSGGEVPIGEADRCYKYYDCSVKSNLALPGKKDQEKGAGIDKSDPMVLKCATPSRILTVHNAAANVYWNTTSSFECDKNVGIWRNGSDQLPAGSSITCSEPPLPPQETEKTTALTEAHVYIIIGASFLLFVLLIALTMFIVYKVKTRKSKIKHLKRKDLQNMTKLTLIKQITEQYAHVLAANPANSQLIIEGWDMIEILLEHNIEDLAVWAAACKFLLRFKLAVGKMDLGIWHMANRYLIIQATKIIERLKWCAETPITMDSPDGLIRTVAIRLIALSLHDKHNPEAHDLAWEGIRALGFRAGQQYPHCGALWAVLPHTRPVETVKRTGENEYFDAATFRARMIDLALSKLEQHRIPMPEEDVRPEFGTIAQQAAYALGGSPNASPMETFNFLAMVYAVQTDQKKNPTLDLSKNRNNVLSVFHGYVEALTRNPLDKIFEATGRMAYSDADKLKSLHFVKPAEEWNALVQKAQVLSVYYGARVDALRFQGIFLPEQAGTDALKKMVDEQMDFQGAVEKELEHLRKWFAQRTDREEFKKKPVYLKNTDKLKLSNAIGKFEPPGKNACSESSKSETDVGKGAQKKADAAATTPAAAAPSGSASASGAGSSGSKSNSGENTPASPAPAAAAAAAPAAPAATPPAAPVAPAKP